MSSHVEWTSARHPFLGIEALPPGEELGEDVTDSDVTLVISGDESMAIEGDFEAVKRLLRIATARVEALEAESTPESG